MQNHEDQKDKESYSSSFREWLIERDLAEEKAAKKVPVSELHEMHKDPTCMVGKPIRIYCPDAKAYYNGRIRIIAKFH